jgi:type VII secretion protein EccB
VQTRRDQVQAYRFAQARLQSALLVADPDRPEPPQRRAGLAIFSGIMISVIVLAGVGIFGLIKKGGKDSWQDASVISVEKETGTRYIYKDGVLHPVLNYASARLILNQADVSVEHISQASLADAPRGLTLGLEGLPDSLPGTDHLVSGPWTVCSSSASGSPTVTMAVGVPSIGDSLGENEAVLVQTPDEAYYLVWRNTRMRIPDLNTVGAAFNYEPGRAVNVSSAWINSVRAGPDFAVRKPAGFGEATSYQVGDQGSVLIGQLFETESGGGVDSRYYIATRSGLALVPNTAGRLILADKGMDPSGKGRPPESIRVSTADIRDVISRSEVSVFDAALPQEQAQMKQAIVDGGGGGEAALCSAYQPNEASAFATTVSLTTAEALPRNVTQGWTVNDEQVNVVVASGQGAVVRNLPHDGRPGISWFVVTDIGAKFQVLPSDGSIDHTLQILGYSGVTAVNVPDELLRLLPSGPNLDQSKVTVEHPVTSS